MSLTNHICHVGVSLIKDLADEVDSMTSDVVAAALDVRRTPGNKETREKLDSLRQSWASKVQALTAAIDDVIDPEDFVTISGESDIVCCLVSTLNHLSIN